MLQLKPIKLIGSEADINSNFPLDVDGLSGPRRETWGRMDPQVSLQCYTYL